MLCKNHLVARTTQTSIVQWLARKDYSSKFLIFPSPHLCPGFSSKDSISTRCRVAPTTTQAKKQKTKRNDTEAETHTPHRGEKQTSGPNPSECCKRLLRFAARRVEGCISESPHEARLLTGTRGIFAPLRQLGHMKATRKGVRERREGDRTEEGRLGNESGKRSPALYSATSGDGNCWAKKTALDVKIHQSTVKRPAVACISPCAIRRYILLPFLDLRVFLFFPGRNLHSVEREELLSPFPVENNLVGPLTCSRVSPFPHIPSPTSPYLRKLRLPNLPTNNFRSFLLFFSHHFFCFPF